MNKFWQVEKEKNRKLTLKEKERINFQQFVRGQLLKLREKGLSLPVATL